jgi:putative SOS response-associated peptidase YedK
MRWGLIPAWWKKVIKDLPATFNARAETIALSGQSGRDYLGS